MSHEPMGQVAREERVPGEDLRLGAHQRAASSVTSRRRVHRHKLQTRPMRERDVRLHFQPLTKVYRRVPELTALSCVLNTPLNH